PGEWECHHNEGMYTTTVATGAAMTVAGVQTDFCKDFHFLSWRPPVRLRCDLLHDPLGGPTRSALRTATRQSPDGLVPATNGMNLRSAPDEHIIRRTRRP